VVSSTPRPHFTPRKDPISILQEAGWASGPVWTGGKSRPHRDSIPDRPARSQSLYRLSYPAHNFFTCNGKSCPVGGRLLVRSVVPRHAYLTQICHVFIHAACVTDLVSCTISHTGQIACCSAPNSRPPATKALHTICGNNTSIVSSS